MSLLEIKNLHVEVDGKKILNGLDLTRREGQRARHHGPERLGQVDARLCARRQGRLRGDRRAGAVRRRGYAGDGARRARRQGPVPRLPVSDRNPGRRHHDVPAHGAQCAAQEARRDRAVDARIHQARARGRAASSASTQDMLRRGVNVGFSGGEKKRNEILQMALFEPRLCVLDETDSGLDIDALKSSSEGVNRLRSPERGFIVITHYQRLLDYIVPDIVHVLSKGRIVQHRRQGAGARARGQRLRAIPGRGGVSGHERRDSPDEDCGRDRAGGELRYGAASAAGRGRSRRCASRRSSASRRAGCRTGASRSGNTPICARSCAMPSRSRAAAGRGGEGARPATPARLLASIEGRRIVFVDGAFVPELSDLADLEPGLTHPLAGAGAGGGRSATSPHMLGKRRADRRRRGRAQYRLHGRWRGDPRRRRRDAGAAVASRLRQCRRPAGRGLHPLAGRDRGGRPRHAGREP